VASGVDISEAMLIVARRRAADAAVAISLDLGDVQALPFDADAFDIVFAVTVLCSVPDPQQAVDEMSRVLAPGARLVIGDLGKWNTWAAWRRLRSWLGSTTWPHTTFPNARQLTNLIHGAGLQPEEIRSAVYYPPQAILAGTIAPIEDRISAVTTLGGSVPRGFSAQAVPLTARRTSGMLAALALDSAGHSTRRLRRRDSHSGPGAVRRP
jgi:SAM-dependent methyltransferase